MAGRKLEPAQRDSRKTEDSGLVAGVFEISVLPETQSDRDIRQGNAVGVGHQPGDLAQATADDLDFQLLVLERKETRGLAAIKAVLVKSQDTERTERHVFKAEEARGISPELAVSQFYQGVGQGSTAVGAQHPALNNTARHGPQVQKHCLLLVLDTARGSAGAECSGIPGFHRKIALADLDKTEAAVFIGAGLSAVGKTALAFQGHPGASDRVKA